MVIVAASALLVAAGACGNAGAPQRRGAQATATTPTGVTPVPTITVSYFVVSAPPDPYFRFAAPVVNPGSETLDGVVVSWTAYDASGAIVGTFTHHMAAIAAHSAEMYVGGAGSAELSGTPARVTAKITNSGVFTSQPSVAFPVKATQFTQSQFPDPTDPAGDSDYEVTGDVTVTGTSTIQTANLDVSIVLTDSSGKIVGADFYQPDNLPSTLGPGTSFAIDDTGVIATAAPAVATITATVDPS
jgi:hypothetical protein